MADLRGRGGILTIVFVVVHSVPEKLQGSNHLQRRSERTGNEEPFEENINTIGETDDTLGDRIRAPARERGEKTHTAVERIIHELNENRKYPFDSSRANSVFNCGTHARAPPASASLDFYPHRKMPLQREPAEIKCVAK